MTETISIEADHSLSSVERWLGQLEQADAAPDLLLNTTLKHAKFGSIVAVSQLLITWAKRFPSGTLRTFVHSENEARDRISRLATYDHGLIALAVSPSVSDRSGAIDLAVTAREALLERLHRMNTVKDATRGAKVFVAVADHIGVWPGSLYDSPPSGEPSVRQSQGFKTLVRQAFDRFVEGPEKFGATSKEVGQLAIAMYELFKNTHDWARHSPDGVPVPKSVRGIRMDNHSDWYDRHVEMTADEPPLGAYLAHPGMKRSDRRSRLIEISIFDSGPGLAARVLRSMYPTSQLVDGATVVDEHHAVLDCLRKHFTTSDESYRGDGLHQVLRMLSGLGAFLRIRTGRLALCRDFLQRPYQTKPVDEPAVFDWTTGLASPAQAPRVEGTAITILFPVVHD